MGYKKSTIRGVSWVSAFRITTRFFSFLKIAVLARLLSPSQFGLFGIASLTLALLELLTETGVNVFLVQTKNDIKEYIDSAWIVSILRGVLITIVIIISSPFIATFFKSQDSLNLLLFISLVPLIRGFINPAVASFQKELKFKQEFLFKSSTFIIDTVITIIVALATSSVYSLVWGLISGVIVELIFSFIFIKPFPKMTFNFNYIKEILHKGKWVTAYGVLNYLGQEGDNIVVGRVLGTTALGGYQMGYKISTLPISEISDVANRVVFPVYTKIEQDRKRLFAAFRKTTIAISLLAIPAGLLIFLFPELIINVLLGSKWLSVAPIIRILALYGVVRAIYGPSSALFLSVGKQKYVTAMNFARFLGLAITIYPFVTWYGLIGAAYSALFSVVVEIPVILYYVILIYKGK